MDKRFWNWAQTVTDNDKRILYIHGVIADDGTWFEDDVTPALFSKELNAGSGDIEVWIDSSGGDVIAAAEIYNMLQEYKSKGKVTTIIGSLAASSAGWIAMAGDEVHMSVAGLLMMHPASTWTAGDSDEMRKTAEMLDTVKEAIINIYAQKTKMSRDKLSKLIDKETWLDATEAKRLGFVDKILYADEVGNMTDTAKIFNQVPDISAVLEKMNRWNKPTKPTQSDGVNDFDALFDRLELKKEYKNDN